MLQFYSTNFHVAEAADICSTVAKQIAAAPIDGTLDESKAAEYSVDVKSLQRKILAVINTELSSDQKIDRPPVIDNLVRCEKAPCKEIEHACK
jgi:hypothetical protein